ERKQNVSEPAQYDPQQHRDRKKRPHPGVEECANDGAAGFENCDRSADPVRLDTLHRARELANRFVVVGIAVGKNLDLVEAVLGHPLTRDIGWDGFERDGLRLKIISQLIEGSIERRNHCVLESLPQGFWTARELYETIRKPVGRQSTRPRLRRSQF